MAAKLSIIVNGPIIEWHAPVTGKFFEFDMRTLHETCREPVTIYGVKQIIADSYAGDASIASKKDSMEKRAAQLSDGTYGTARSGLVDGDTYRALVALGKLPVDTDEMRDKWRGLKSSQRAKFTKLPEVAEWIAANTEATTAEDVKNLLDDILR